MNILIFSLVLSLLALSELSTEVGTFNMPVQATQDTLTIGDDPIRLVREPEPQHLPWKKEQIDIVLECTGRFNEKAAAKQHIDAGANKVIMFFHRVCAIIVSCPQSEFFCNFKLCTKGNDPLVVPI